MEVAEHQPSALRYRRTHAGQRLPDLDPAEQSEGGPNHRTKKLPRRFANWDQRIGSEVENNPVGGSLVGDKEIPVVDTLAEEGGTVLAEDKCSAGEGRVAGNTEIPVVGRMTFPAAALGMDRSAVEGRVNLVVEDKVIPVAEDNANPGGVGMVVAHIRAEETRMRILPEAA